jgi:hypothetical protein
MDNIEDYEKHFAERIATECDTGDAEVDHEKADEIMVEFLQSLGLYNIANRYLNVNKWYA